MNTRTMRRLMALSFLTGIDIPDPAKESDSEALTWLSELIVDEDIPIAPESRGNVKSLLDEIGFSKPAYSTAIVPEITRPPEVPSPVKAEIVADHVSPPATPKEKPAEASEVRPEEKPPSEAAPSGSMQEPEVEKLISQCVTDVLYAHKNLSRIGFGWLLDGMGSSLSQAARAEVFHRALEKQA